MVSPIATNITEIFRNPRVLSGAAIVSGLVGLLALFFINNVYVQVYPLMLLFAGLLSMYTLSSRKEKLSLDFRLGTLIYLAFLLSMCLTVLMYVRSDFSRGLLVYISIIIMYVTGLLSALRIQNLYLSVFILVAAGIVHRATVFYGGPLILGNDPLWHNRIAEEIIISRSLHPLIEEQSKYYYSPLYHIFVGSGTIIFNTNIRNVSFLLITIPYVFVPSFVLLSLAQNYFNHYVGIIAVFLFVTADSTVGWSVLPSTTTLGVTTGSICVYLLVKHLQNRRYIYQILLLPLFMVVLATHQVSAFITACALTLIWGFYTIYEI